MSGLRRWERDASLPERAGDPLLRAPGEAEIAERLSSLLLPAESPPVAAVDWTYARWKPGVSITCAYDVCLEDGKRFEVAAKRYADGKESSLAGRRPAAERVVLPEERLALWTLPGDRILTGIAAFLDARKVARLIEENDLYPKRAIRRRLLERAILRYKPERRIVARLDLHLRNVEPDRTSLVARLHPPERAATIAAARRAWQVEVAEAFTPWLHVADTRRGLLLETWFDVETPPAGTFAHAGDAARLLAALHRPAFSIDLPSRDEPDDQRPLFATNPELERAYSMHPRVEPAAIRVWCHGDFHPDQIAYGRRSGRPRLLDLDRLHAGEPARDLASWIADHLDEDPRATFEDAAGPLVEPYLEAQGPAVDPHRLALLVADELVLRAAAAIRRLESGALEHARASLERARSLAARKRLHA